MKLPLTRTKEAPSKDKVATASVASRTSGVSSKSQKNIVNFFRLFQIDPVRVDIIVDEEMAHRQYKGLIRLVMNELYAIVVLTAILILSIPFAQPIYQYFALNPEQKTLGLVALEMPNMTNNAVISWTTIAITEIMTMGFGDYESHLKAQRFRFTPEGWDGFAKAFDRQKIGQSFKEHQLVLTTVPSNSPVIVGQGENAQHIYQWNVQMPVIMTFATNNNVTRRTNSVINLTIVRVPTDQNPAGIGIKTWSLGG